MMIEESFVNGNSLIHRLNPVLKIGFAIIYSFVVAVSSKFPSLFAALFIALFLVILARLNPRKAAVRLAAVNGIIILFWFFLPFTFQGEALFHIGPFAVTRPGVIFAAGITLKANAILIAFIALVATMRVTTLGHALNSMLIPEKLVQFFLLTYRYLFVIQTEYQKLTRAVKVRGFRPGTNLHTYRTYAYLAGMLFVRASVRGERVYQAMLCRGFKGKFYSLHEYSISKADITCAVFMTAAIAILVVLEWTKII